MVISPLLVGLFIVELLARNRLALERSARDRGRLSLLHRTDDLLASSLGVEGSVPEVARHLVEVFADWVTVEQGEPRGTGDALRRGQPHVQSDRLLVLNGDDLFGAADLADLASRPAGVLVAEVQEPRKFGIAYLKPDGTLERLVEKPNLNGRFPGNTGAYLFPREVFDIELKLSARGEYEITDAIQYLIDSGYRVESHIVDGWWKDTGRLEDILEMLTEAKAIAEELGNTEIRAEAMAWRVPAFVALSDVDSARREVGELLQNAEATAQPFMLHVAEHYGSAIALADGRFQEAEARARAEKETPSRPMISLARRLHWSRSTMPNLRGSLPRKMFCATVRFGARDSSW